MQRFWAEVCPVIQSELSLMWCPAWSYHFCCRLQPTGLHRSINHSVYTLRLQHRAHLHIPLCMWAKCSPTWRVNANSLSLWFELWLFIDFIPASQTALVACSDRLPSPPVSHMCEKPLACHICVYAFTWSCVANLCESARLYLFSLKKVRVGGCLSVCVHIHTLKSDFTGYIQAVLIVCLRWSIFCYYCPIMPLSCERIPLNNLNYTIRALKQPWYPEKTFT